MKKIKIGKIANIVVIVEDIIQTLLIDTSHVLSTKRIVNRHNFNMCLKTECIDFVPKYVVDNILELSDVDVLFNEYIEELNLLNSRSNK